MSPKAHRPAHNHPWRRVAKVHAEAPRRQAWCYTCGAELLVTTSPQGVNRYTAKAGTIHDAHACSRFWKLLYQGANPDPEKPPTVRIPRP